MSASLLNRADDVTNEVMNAVAHTDDDIVVRSPPGAGKTRLLEDVSALAVLILEMRVMVACPSNDQATEVTARIAKAYPQIRIDRFVKRGGGIPSKLRGLPNVTVVDKAEDLHGNITVGTVKKFAEVEELDGPRDLALFEEAYQTNFAGFLRVHDMAGRRMAIGDPGQIDPFTKASLRHFASDPLGPHVAAPKAMLAANLARPFDLPLTRRLPQDTVEIVRPAFYPTLSFSGVAPAGQRRVDHCAAGSTPNDQLLDRALGAGSLSMISLPREDGPRVDSEIVGLVADLVDRMMVRQFHVFDDDDGERAITPDDIGVVAYHRDQVAALRAAIGPQHRGIHVETANRFQGLEKKVIFSLHSLSGKRRLDGFSTLGGRMCVAASRHRVNCIIVGRDGVQDILDRFSPDDARYLGQVDDPYYDGWRAHSVFARALEERNAIIRR